MTQSGHAARDWVGTFSSKQLTCAAVRNWDLDAAQWQRAQSVMISPTPVVSRS